MTGTEASTMVTNPSTQNSGHEDVVVIDLGGQYARLIARRIREIGVHSIVLGADVSAEQIAKLSPRAIILSGGPASVYEPNAPSIDRNIYSLDAPVLGICYGMQLIAKDLGGAVVRNDVSEYGRTQMEVVEESFISSAIGEATNTSVWMSHRDAVSTPPADCHVTASTQAAEVAAFQSADSRIMGVQFHPEVVHTPWGMDFLEKYLVDVAGASCDWSPDSVIEEQLASIRQTVGNRGVLCALSGGVDSSVAAVLVHRAIGDHLTCVFVDHGLLRAGEAEQVVDTFRNHEGINLVHVDASTRFLALLEGVSDPEKKRKIIGEAFIRIFEEEATRIAKEQNGDLGFLVQGTLYSDVIESGGSSSAETIKSHHNVGGLPADMQMELLEPLRDLFKDEVRRVGTALGLPDSMVWRQPFPGPGLAIRIIGAVNQERLEIVRAADHIVRQEVAAAGLERELWQWFAVLPAEVRTVGVQGDSRSYAHPIVLRIVASDDAMTADWARLPHELVERISTRIVNEVAGVNRVLLDVTAKPPSTIEWE